MLDNNLQVKPEHRQYGPISAEEFDKQMAYWRETDNLQLIVRQFKTSRILLVQQLWLFLDTERFLCCSRRIHNASLSKVTKFPYLLPSKHPFSRLIVLDIHVILCHSGTNAALRQTYWIPTARQYIKSILHYCLFVLALQRNHTLHQTRLHYLI